MIIVTNEEEWKSIVKAQNLSRDSYYNCIGSAWLKPYIEKYPKLFAPPEHICSLGCPEEWAETVGIALDKLAKLPIEIVQIKEKFGGLRIYWQQLENAIPDPLLWEQAEGIISDAILASRDVSLSNW